MCWNFHLGDIIESAKKFVEHSDQFFWRAGTRQFGEPHDICVEDTTQTQRGAIISHIWAGINDLHYKQ